MLPVLDPGVFPRDVVRVSLPLPPPVSESFLLPAFFLPDDSPFFLPPFFVEAFGTGADIPSENRSPSFKGLQSKQRPFKTSPSIVKACNSNPLSFMMIR